MVTILKNLLDLYFKIFTSIAKNIYRDK